MAKPKIIKTDSKYFEPIVQRGRKPMIAWKPMVVYGGPNYPHRPWGPLKPRPWGKSYSGPWGKPQKRLMAKILKKNNPVAWGKMLKKSNILNKNNAVAWSPPQPRNIDTSAFDTPDMSDYLDDYEQGNLSLN